MPAQVINYQLPVSGRTTLAKICEDHIKQHGGTIVVENSQANFQPQLKEISTILERFLLGGFIPVIKFNDAQSAFTVNLNEGDLYVITIYGITQPIRKLIFDLTRSDPTDSNQRRLKKEQDGFNLSDSDS